MNTPLTGLESRSYGGLPEPHSRKTEASSEERLELLEAEMQAIGSRLNEVSTKLFEESIAREMAIDKEKRAREHDKEELLRAIVTANTGGLSLAAIGVVWLGVGVTLGTFPVELANHFR